MKCPHWAEESDARRANLNQKRQSGKHVATVWGGREENKPCKGIRETGRGTENSTKQSKGVDIKWVNVPDRLWDFLQRKDRGDLKGPALTQGARLVGQAVDY